MHVPAIRPDESSLLCWCIAGEPPPSGQATDSNGLPFTQDWSGTGVRILGEMPSSVQQASLDFSEKVSQAGQRSHWLGGDRVQVRRCTTTLGVYNLLELNGGVACSIWLLPTAMNSPDGGWLMHVCLIASGASLPVTNEFVELALACISQACIYDPV